MSSPNGQPANIRLNNDLLVLMCSTVNRVPSGGELLVLELAKRWSSRKGRVYILAPKEEEDRIRELGAPNIELLRLSSWVPGSVSTLLAYACRSIVSPLEVVRFVGRHQTRVFLSESPFIPDLIACWVARAFGLSWIQSWQLVIPAPWIGYQDANGDHRGVGTSALARALTRWRLTLSYLSQEIMVRTARRWCSALLVPSLAMAGEARARGFRESQVHVAGYGVDFAQVGRATTQAPKESTYDAVFLGRFHAQKGLDDLIAIWKLVSTAQPWARLAVIGDGDGPDADRFKRQLLEIGRGVEWLGVLTGDDKYRILARSKVFLFPSRHESWGHVVLEAIAAGLPVVGYDIPSSKEVFGDAILRVPVADIERFAQAVTELIEKPYLRAQLNGKAHRLTEGWDWDRIADRFFKAVGV